MAKAARWRSAYHASVTYDSRPGGFVLELAMDELDAVLELRPQRRALFFDLMTPLVRVQDYRELVERWTAAALDAQLPGQGRADELWIGTGHLEGLHQAAIRPAQGELAELAFDVPKGANVIDHRVDVVAAADRLHRAVPATTAPRSRASPSSTPRGPASSLSSRTTVSSSSTTGE